MIDFQEIGENSLEITDDLVILKNQIISLLNTPKNSILGVYSFGYELEEMLYSLELTESQIVSEIKNQIVKWIPLANKYMVDVKARFFRGEIRDICVIDILIDGDKFAGFVVK